MFAKYFNCTSSIDHVRCLPCISLFRGGTAAALFIFAQNSKVPNYFPDEPKNIPRGHSNPSPRREVRFQLPTRFLPRFPRFFTILLRELPQQLLHSRFFFPSCTAIVPSNRNHFREEIINDETHNGSRKFS